MILNGLIVLAILPKVNRLANFSLSGQKRLYDMLPKTKLIGSSFNPNVRSMIYPAIFTRIDCLSTSPPCTSCHASSVLNIPAELLTCKTILMHFHLYFLFIFTYIFLTFIHPFILNLHHYFSSILTFSYSKNCSIYTFIFHPFSFFFCKNLLPPYPPSPSLMLMLCHIYFAYIFASHLSPSCTLFLPLF